MDEALRPDLSRILPRPWLRRTPPGPPLGEALHSPAGAGGADFVVAVTRRRAPEPDDAGFGIHQAQAIANRLAAVFASAPAQAVVAHRMAAERVQPLLGDAPAPPAAPAARR